MMNSGQWLMMMTVRMMDDGRLMMVMMDDGDLLMIVLVVQTIMTVMMMTVMVDAVRSMVGGWHR